MFPDYSSIVEIIVARSSTSMAQLFHSLHSYNVFLKLRSVGSRSISSSEANVCEAYADGTAQTPARPSTLT